MFIPVAGMMFIPVTGMMFIPVAGMTMLLTLSVLQVIVSEKLPTTSDAVPLIGKSHYYSAFHRSVCYDMT